MPEEHAWILTWWGLSLTVIVGSFFWWALIHYTM